MRSKLEPETTELVALDERGTDKAEPIRQAATERNEIFIMNEPQIYGFFECHLNR